MSNAILILKRLVVGFQRNTAGSIAPIVALTLIPIMTAVGATVDYTRANNIRSKMQGALDTGLLAGARENTSNWAQIAVNVFDANLKAKVAEGVPITKSFVQESGQIFRATASAHIPHFWD